MFEDSEGGISWWKVALSAVLAIGVAILGFLGARKFNLFGLGVDANASGAGSSQKDPNPFVKDMPLAQVREFAASKVESSAIKLQLNEMANYVQSTGRDKLGETKLPDRKHPFPDEKTFYMVSVADPKNPQDRYMFLNYVPPKRIAEIVANPKSAAEYFPEIGSKELAVIQKTVKDYTGDVNVPVPLTVFNQIANGMREARKEDEKDKAALQAKGVAPAGVAPAPAGASAPVVPAGAMPPAVAASAGR